MADNLTDTIESRALDWINAIGTPTRPTGPLKCRLMTANGSDSVAGTEVVAGGGYTAGGIAATIAAASTGATSNTAALTWANMPRSETVTGVELWDQAGTPVRVWYGALTASRAVTAGDTFDIAIGELDLTLG